jgi:hypothetical protein
MYGGDFVGREWEPMYADPLHHSARPLDGYLENI